ncbi:MAG TPA: hemerythrin domain-containing protein [Candidatus Kapabacteria bacterium]|nr:hemerythrin domain-containing protein [Candidatus Kapabacteria bacterium]
MDLFQPVPDFDRPIEALYICHTNILKRMDQIDALAAQLLEDGAPVFGPQVQIWEELVSFFRHSIANHTRDEDEGLFPLLAGRGGAVVERMEFDHRWIEQSEETMINRFEALRSGEHPVSNTAVRELAMMAREVTRHYRDHIKHENEEVFPLAEQVLNDGEKGTLGGIMRKHRNIEVVSMPAEMLVRQKTD